MSIRALPPTTRGVIQLICATSDRKMSAIEALISRRRDRVLVRDHRCSGQDSPASSSIQISNRRIWVGSSQLEIGRYCERTWGTTKPRMFRGAILSASRLSPSTSQQFLICGYTISPSEKKATNPIKVNQKIKTHTKSLKKLFLTKSWAYTASDTRCPFLSNSAYPRKGLRSLTTIRVLLSFQTKHRK